MSQHVSSDTTPNSNQLIAQVAIPSPLPQTFDYLVPDHCQRPQIGARVRVPFGPRELIGIVTGLDNQTSAKKLRALKEVLDTESLLPQSILDLITRGARYYHYALGQCFNIALPKLINQGEYPSWTTEQRWQIVAAKDQQTAVLDSLKRAKRQQEIYQLLTEYPAGLSAEDLNQQTDNWRPALKALLDKALIQVATEQTVLPEPNHALSLSTEQQTAIHLVSSEKPKPWLLRGVTGSGKTEVYLRLARQTLEQGKQVLILVPEIGLTPQLLQRCQKALGNCIVSLHSGMTDKQRLSAWSRMRANDAQVVIGTRSAVFCPLAKPGLIIVDEEHDGSFKQQDTWRYSARDLAVMRGALEQTPVVLGSATPSLETLYNADNDRYGRLDLTERAGNAKPPNIHLLDIGQQVLDNGLSPLLLKAVHANVDDGNQTLLFINRRGFAPVMLCNSCGWNSECPRCDARLTVHRQDNSLQCHHCGYIQGVPHQCPSCQSTDIAAVGQGTQRIEDTLEKHFPGTPVLRIDRDSTRRKGSLQAMLDTINSGQPCILTGTQMLAKGHHFPRVTLVGILDIDGGFYSVDFRTPEKIAQMVLQVAGRSGREQAQGTVYIQTSQPHNPLLQHIIEDDYMGWASTALTERQILNFPPIGYLALLRAEGTHKLPVHDFLREAMSLAPSIKGLAIMGPAPSPMERVRGHYRAQVLVQTADRALLHNALNQWLPAIRQLKSASKTRWSIDVDPVDLY